MKKHQILIIGGGASGVYLSLLLADYGLDVAIVEGKDRILKKLLVTGNGRCNITNEKVMEEIPLKYQSHNKSYDFSPLQTYTLDDTLSYFKSLGLHFTTLDDHKMYPASLQASAVVDLLRLSLEEKGVSVYLNEKVTSLMKKEDDFILKTTTETFMAQKVVVSTGGASQSGTGSDGSMYKILKSLGHEIISPKPALVQLELKHPSLRGLSGTKFEGTATLYHGDILLQKESGEILFTDYGISGPPILQLSRFLYEDDEMNHYTLHLDLFPDMTKEELKNRVLDQVAMFGYRSSMDGFKSILPSKLIPIVLKESGLDRPSSIIEDVDPLCFITLSSILKDWSFEITGTKGFHFAQGTSGGLSTKELDRNLASLLIPNLYFTGEVIDVLGACGGYNLQWAWSSAGTVMKALTREI